VLHSNIRREISGILEIKDDSYSKDLNLFPRNLEGKFEFIRFGYFHFIQLRANDNFYGEVITIGTRTWNNGID